MSKRWWPLSAASTSGQIDTSPRRIIPGIRARFERYARKYNSRNRLKIESEEMGQLIKDGNMAGLHVYSILYNYRETSSLEQRGVKVKRKDYWVRSTDCYADPKSTRRNLNALFSG